MNSFTLESIKYSIDPSTFEKAVDLYESGKVKDFTETAFSYKSTVIGTSPYKVEVYKNDFMVGNCNCYLGQDDELCKHMIALAIHSIYRGDKLPNDEKQSSPDPSFSGKIGELSSEELAEVNFSITNALRYIKPYDGPSKIWFQYQDSLFEGCYRLSEIISTLPVSIKTAELLVKLLKRLDRKLLNGVDDSDGTVGRFIMGTVDILHNFADVQAAVITSFKKLQNLDTMFYWEESLIERLGEV